MLLGMMMLLRWQLCQVSVSYETSTAGISWLPIVINCGCAARLCEIDSRMRAVIKGPHISHAKFSHRNIWLLNTSCIMECFLWAFSTKNLHVVLIAAKFSRWTDKRLQNRTLEALFGIAELATQSLHSWRKAFTCRRYQRPPTVHLFFTPKRIFHTVFLQQRRYKKSYFFSQWLHLWFHHLSWRFGNKISSPHFSLVFFVAGNIDLFHPPEVESASNQT